MTPDVRVLRGEPDDLELAALVAGMAAAGSRSHPVDPSADAEPAARARRRWRAAAGPTGGVVTRGADAWRWSAVAPPRL